MATNLLVHINIVIACFASYLRQGNEPLAGPIGNISRTTSVAVKFIEGYVWNELDDGPFPKKEVEVEKNSDKLSLIVIKSTIHNLSVWSSP